MQQHILHLRNIIFFPNYREHHPKQDSFLGLLEGKSDLEFFKDLRLSRTSFATALQVIQDAYGESPSGTDLYLGPKPALYLTLWYLGTQSTYREISEMFGFSKSTVFECVQRVIDVLCAAGNRYITWPTAEEAIEFEREFRRLGSISGVIGALDGCHVNIKAPSETQSDYLDRTHTHSVNLMAVCSPDMRFTFIQAGFPGSAHDSRVFKTCSLFTKMQQNDAIFFQSPDYHLVGDSAFGLHKYLMVPIKNTGNLSGAEARFNRKLSAGRVVIENTFAFLKGRFRRLKYIDTDIDRIPKIIKASCVLHNIALQDPDDVYLLESEGPVEHPVQLPAEPERSPVHQRQGVEKRLKLVRTM